MTVSERPAADFLRTLEGSVSGLLFPSETDAPLAPIELRDAQGHDLSPEALRRSLGLPESTHVETLSIDELFDPLLEGAADDDSDMQRFRDLRALLARELTDPRVYRVGTTDIDVYILGRSASGEWLGLKTHVVET